MLIERKVADSCGNSEGARPTAKYPSEEAHGLPAESERMGRKSTDMFNRALCSKTSGQKFGGTTFFMFRYESAVFFSLAQMGRVGRLL